MTVNEEFIGAFRMAIDSYNENADRDSIGVLREKIETMLAVRGPVYEACADVILQTDNKSFYEIICHIEKLLAK